MIIGFHVYPLRYFTWSGYWLNLNVVTAVSANHYGESQGLIKDIHQQLLYFYPEIKLVVYDLGLTNAQWLAMHLIKLAT
jgi:hypothetical protein